MSALTTWLTAIADAIRGKDGTALPIDHADFPDKITAIPQLDTSDATLTANDMLYGVTGYGADGTKLTGAGANWQYILTLNSCFSNSAYMGKIEIYSPLVENIGYAFSGASANKIILTTGIITSCVRAFRNNLNLVTLTLNCDFSTVTGVQDIFYNCPLLSTINGSPLDFSSVELPYTNAFGSLPKLVNVDFIPSAMKVDFYFSSSPLLSTVSLLSIANGLDAAAPATLTMHATSKTNMDNIMVNNVAGVATYHATDPDTDMTLSAFITGVKGWTIA